MTPVADPSAGHYADGVIEDGHGSWAIDVKTRPFGAADGHGLLRVREAFPCYRPIPPLRPGGA